MSNKPRKKKKKQQAAIQPRTAPAKKNPKYSAGELAMAILGAALVIMVAAIIITSVLE
jgi:cell division protein FtsL